MFWKIILKTIQKNQLPHAYYEKYINTLVKTVPMMTTNVYNRARTIWIDCMLESMYTMTSRWCSIEPMMKTRLELKILAQVSYFLHEKDKEKEKKERSMRLGRVMWNYAGLFKHNLEELEKDELFKRIGERFKYSTYFINRELDDPAIMCLLRVCCNKNSDVLISIKNDFDKKHGIFTRIADVIDKNPSIYWFEKLCNAYVSYIIEFKSTKKVALDVLSGIKKVLKDTPVGHPSLASLGKKCTDLVMYIN